MGSCTQIGSILMRLNLLVSILYDLKVVITRSQFANNMGSAFYPVSIVVVLWAPERLTLSKIKESEELLVLPTPTYGQCG